LLNNDVTVLWRF